MCSSIGHFINAYVILEVKTMEVKNIENTNYLKIEDGLKHVLKTLFDTYF